MTASNPTFVPPYWQTHELDALLRRAFEEDLTGGDVTSWSLIPEHQDAIAHAVAKQDLVVCGLEVAKRAFAMLVPDAKLSLHVHDGQWITSGTRLFSIDGEVHGILAAERTVLNLLQHMSGIATFARQFARAVEGTHTRIVDTRKTLPGLRAFQRYAVRVGGCFNHRYQLGAGILIKENHIRAAGSISAAVQRAKHNAPHTLRVEIEVTSFEELQQALDAGAELIMLDNMSPEQVKQAVSITQGKALLEASGGITLQTVRAYADAGADIISVGALTHSVKAADISLLIEHSPQGENHERNQTGNSL